MNVQEFKAWMKGFNFAIDGVPTKSQWDEIKKQIEGVTAVTSANLPLSQWKAHPSRSLDCAMTSSAVHSTMNLS